MLPDVPKLPGEDFIHSGYPILIALVLGLIIGIRNYMRGTKCPSEARIDKKVVIVTGANSGIGFEIAKNLACRGGKVILACRDKSKGEDAIEKLKKSVGEHLDVHFMKLDLSSLQSVRDFAAAFCANETKLDILINNAGIMCHPLEKTADGYELHFQTNYLGHFLLTHLLLDKLKARENSRIVNLTANAYQLGELDMDDLMFEQREYKPSLAYSQSKLAVMLFTHELAKHLQETKVAVYAANPGIVRTHLHRHMPFRKNVLVSVPFAPFIWYLMKTAYDGAQTAIYCAVSNEESGVSGKLYSECKMVPAEAKAVDNETAGKLWDISLRLCKLNTRTSAD